MLPLKALVMNGLTLAATLRHPRVRLPGRPPGGALDYQSQGALQLTQPVLLFAISFGLATDYGVFLLTRIKEAWDSGLPNREAVAIGLERTGRIVTAAALLFCIAVGAFATSKIILVKEVGLGIALAVPIDASIVRALLVPVADGDPRPLELVAHTQLTHQGRRVRTATAPEPPATQRRGESARPVSAQ